MTIQAPPRRAVNLPRPTLAKITSKPKGLPNRVILHAVQKWGKTSFAAQTPSPIFLCTRGEDGLDTLIKSGMIPETAHFEDNATTWSDILMALDELLVMEHTYKTFVLDTINGAERLAIEHVVDTQFKGDMEKYDSYGRGVKFLVPEFLKLVMLLDNLRAHRNMSIVLLAHSQVKTFQNPTGPNYDRWEPVLEKQNWAQLDRWVDMILFGDFETFADKDRKDDKKAKATGGQQRIIHTERHAAFDAGNRYGLPAEIDCGDNAQTAWTNFVTALHPKKSVPQSE